jgi:hypothetical protein
MSDSTCYLNRSSVRQILIGQPDENLDITEAVLRDIDQLPILTAADILAVAQQTRMPVAFRFEKANGTYSYVENIDAEENRFKHIWEPLFLTASAVAGKAVAYRIGHSGGGYHYADANSPPREPEKWIALYPESSLFDESACRGSSEASQHHKGDLEPGSSEAAQCAPQPSGERVAYLIEHPTHGKVLDFQAITEADRKYGYSQKPLYDHPAVSCAAREALMFEFYRFSYPNRWDWPHERMWEDFQACRGSVSWQRCERSADAILSLPAAGGEASKREADNAKLADGLAERIVSMARERDVTCELLHDASDVQVFASAEILAALSRKDG